MGVYGERTFQAEGTARTKARRQDWGKSLAIIKMTMVKMATLVTVIPVWVGQGL